MSARQSIGNAFTGLGEKIKPDESPGSPVIPAKTPGWIVFLTFVGAAVLLTIGVLVLATGKDIWENPDPPETSLAPTKTVSKVVKKPGKKLGKKAAKKTGRTRGKAQIISREVTVERASQDGGRSETVAMATLATGAALLLAGGFAARLTKIKLPGVEMDAAAAYSAGAADGTATTAKVAKVAKETGKEDVLEDEGKLAEAGTMALRTRIE